MIPVVHYISEIVCDSVSCLLIYWLWYYECDSSY